MPYEPTPVQPGEEGRSGQQTRRFRCEEAASQNYYKAFFDGLRAGGFVCYEMCSPIRGGGIENLDRTARESLACLKKLI